MKFPTIILGIPTISLRIVNEKQQFTNPCSFGESFFWLMLILPLPLASGSKPLDPPSSSFLVEPALDVFRERCETGVPCVEVVRVIWGL